jgi:ParB family chromosome partitioning protein
VAVKRGLGRGLEALIPAAEGEESGLVHVRPDEVSSNPLQPRLSFDEEGLASLASSIATVGLLQPITVRPDPEGGYTLIAGERRLRAARMAGLTSIPALVRQGEDLSGLTEALVENLQRADLSPLEEAAAYRQLLEDFGLTHEEVGRRVGRSRATVTNALRLLQLPAAVQGMIERGELSAGHGRALLAIEDRAYMEHVAARAVAEGWSVRQVEEAASARRGSQPSRGRTRVREVRPAEIIELEQRLAEKLETKVKVDYRAGRGSLHLRYGSLEELERLFRRLMG